MSLSRILTALTMTAALLGSPALVHAQPDKPVKKCHQKKVCHWVPPSCTNKPQRPAPCPPSQAVGHNVCVIKTVCNDP